MKNKLKDKDKVKERKTKKVIKHKGNIYIIFVTTVYCITIIFFLIVYMLFMQVNTQVYKLKQDIFYVVQNAYFALNQENLSYSNYVVEDQKLFEMVDYIMQKNNPNGNVKINSIYYDYNTHKVNINYTLKLKPIVLKKSFKNVSIKLNDSIKMKGMEVE